MSSFKENITYIVDYYNYQRDAASGEKRSKWFLNYDDSVGDYEALLTKFDPKDEVAKAVKNYKKSKQGSKESPDKGKVKHTRLRLLGLGQLTQVLRRQYVATKNKTQKGSLDYLRYARDANVPRIAMLNDYINRTTFTEK